MFVEHVHYKLSTAVLGLLQVQRSQDLEYASSGMSEHDLTKFGLGLKRHFICSVLFFVLFFFSFYQGPIQTSLAELGTPQ